MLLASVPYKFSTPWGASAGSSYLTSPIPATTVGAAASQALGFPPITAAPTGSGGVPPNVADFNGGLNYATLWAQWLQAGGPITYDATFSAAIGGYPMGAMLAQAANLNRQWVSTVDNNTSDPDTGGANWIDPRSIVQVAVVNITATGAFSFVVPATCYNIDEMIAVSGGGGGQGGTTAQAGAGGGAGASAKWAGPVTPGTTITGSIGVGGAAGTSGNNGGAGGNTTIVINGATITLTGGGGGNASGGVASGGSPGTGSLSGTLSGLLLNSGGFGGDGSQPALSTYGGMGGGSLFGGGGRGDVGAGGGSAPSNGLAYGSGGGGSYNGNFTAGAGAAGVVTFRYYNIP